MSARIMVVDDEEVTGRLLLYQLQSFGYEPVYLQDGLQALQRVLIEQPDLILLDVMMPHISGWEVCREVRACSSVPIIMLTAKDADDDIVAGLGAGADDYVTKPFNMAQLHARIEAVLRRSGQREVWGAAATVSSGSGRRTAAITPALGTPTMAPARAAGATAPAAPAQGRMRAEQALRVAAPAPELVAMPQHSTAAAQSQQEMRPAVVPTPAAYTPAVRQRPRLGTRLQHERQSRGLSLYQAERLSRIRWDYLQALEQENWDYVPRPHLRATLQTYAALLRIDLGEYVVQRPNGATHVLTPQLTTLLIALMVVLLMVVVVMIGARL